jgi:hypothetical protein
MAMAADDMYEDEVDLRTPLLQVRRNERCINHGANILNPTSSCTNELSALAPSTRPPPTHAPITFSYLCIQLGDDVPNFSCDTTQGFVTLHDTIQGKWVMIFTMPKNLDPISVSALAAVAKLKEEFDARNVSVYGLGVDSKMNHKVWVSDTYELQV